MNVAFTWQDLPSTATPLDAANLNSFVADLLPFTFLPSPTGNAATDTANVTAALAAAKITGGKVLAQPAPWPGYVMNATGVVGSGVLLQGAGRGGTIFTPDTGFAGPVLEVSKGGATNPNVTEYEFNVNGWNNGIRDLSVWGNSIPSPASVNAGPVNDIRQVANGIYIHDVDHTFLDNVGVAWLSGYGLRIGNDVRESNFYNVTNYRCGNPGVMPAMWYTDPTVGDQDNLISFYGLRIVYPHGIGQWADSSGDPASQGVRLIHFWGGGTEAGGYGGTPGKMQTIGTAFPYDLIKLERASDWHFHGHELATNSGQKIINCVGANLPVGSVNIDGGSGVLSDTGPGIYADNITLVKVSGGSQLETNGGKFITITANTGSNGGILPAPAVVVDDTVTLVDLTLGIITDNKHFDFAARPLLFRGPTEAPRYVGAAGQPAFATNFTNFGVGQANVSFRKCADGTVQISGCAKTTATVGALDPIFTLPDVGYAPSTGAVLAPGNYATIGTDGVVHNNLGVVPANTAIFFEGCNFPAGA